MGFTEQEHEWLRWNYESDQKQQDESGEVTAKKGFMMAVSDPKTWLMMATLYATYTIFYALFRIVKYYKSIFFFNPNHLYKLCRYNSQGQG